MMDPPHIELYISDVESEARNGHDAALLIREISYCNCLKILGRVCDVDIGNRDRAMSRCQRSLWNVFWESGGPLVPAVDHFCQRHSQQLTIQTETAYIASS